MLSPSFSCSVHPDDTLMVTEQSEGHPDWPVISGLTIVYPDDYPGSQIVGNFQTPIQMSQSQVNIGELPGYQQDQILWLVVWLKIASEITTITQDNLGNCPPITSYSQSQRSEQEGIWNTGHSF